MRVTHAGLNPADLAQREGSYPAPPGSPQRHPRTRGLGDGRGLRGAGARLEARRPRLRPRRRRRARRPRRRAPALRGARCRTRSTSPAPPPCPRRSSPRTTRSAARPALSMGETLLVHGAAGGVGSAAVQIGVVCGARVLGTRAQRRGGRARARARRRADRRRRLRRRRAGGHATGAGRTSSLELVGAPHFPDNLRAVAVQGRIVDRRPRRRRRGLAGAAPADGAARQHARDDAARAAARAEGAGAARVRARGRCRTSRAAACGR